MQMSDKDINSLKMIIETIKKNNNHDLSFPAFHLKWKLNLQADQDSKDFLETLLKDYNYYSSHSLPADQCAYDCGNQGQGIKLKLRSVIFRRI